MPKTPNKLDTKKLGAKRATLSTVTAANTNAIASANNALKLPSQGLSRRFSLEKKHRRLFIDFQKSTHERSLERVTRIRQLFLSSRQEGEHVNKSKLSVAFEAETTRV